MNINKSTIEIEQSKRMVVMKLIPFIFLTCILINVLSTSDISDKRSLALFMLLCFSILTIGLLIYQSFKPLLIISKDEVCIRGIGFSYKSYDIRLVRIAMGEDYCELFSNEKLIRHIGREAVSGKSWIELEENADSGKHGNNAPS